MENVSVLLVMSEDMQREFGELISAEQLSWKGVLNCNQARIALARDPNLSVVVCNDSLPDGNWYCLLKELVHRDLDVNLVVVVPEGCCSATIESHGIHAVLNYPPAPSAGRTVAQAATASRQAVTA